MRPADRIVVAIVATLAVGPHTALGAEDARALVAGCRSCHQANATKIPSLAGQSRESLVDKLRAFRTGSQPATVMPELVKGYTDAEIEAIAAYLARSEQSR
jgi:cytochrome c553